MWSKYEDRPVSEFAKAGRDSKRYHAAQQHKSQSSHVTAMDGVDESTDTTIGFSWLATSVGSPG